MGIRFCQERGKPDHRRSRMSGQHIQTHGPDGEAPNEAT